MGFAERLCALMAERGASERALARQVVCDRSYIHLLKHGKRQPGARIAQRLDDALSAGGELAAAAAYEIDRSRIPAALRARGTTGATSSPLPVAPELVDYFHAQLAGHYTADRFLGSPQLIPIAATQHELISRLAAGATGRVRRALWGVGTAYAALLGWLYQDAGNIERSGHWHGVMLNSAHRTHGTQIVSWALTNAALLQADLGDGLGALDLTDAALSPGPSRLCPKVRVLALQQAAHGHSLIGDRANVDRLLSEAGALTDRIDDGYPWGGAVLTPHYLDVQRATCYGRLGLWREARLLWDEILGDLPTTATPGRDSGVFRARRACALAGDGEPDEAVRLAAQVVPIAEHTGSSRMWREVASLLTIMRQWKHEQAARELDELLRRLGQSRRA